MGYADALLNPAVLLRLALAAVAALYCAWTLYHVLRAKVRRVRVGAEKRKATSMVRLPTPRPYLDVPHGRRTHTGRTPDALRALRGPQPRLEAAGGDGDTSSLADDLDSHLIGDGHTPREAQRPV
jgi:hypothetical protein